MMKRINSSIIAPKGFRALGVHCGIKKEKKDLGVIFSETPALCAAFFTTNAITSAHIQVDKEHLKKSPYVRAIIANSGNANCCTGKKGVQACLAMSEEIAKVFKVKKEEVLVASTGVIGEQMPIEKVKNAILKFPALASKDGAADFAESILTTDTKTKEFAVAVDIAGTTIKIGGVAKGAGMISPLMATTLMFVTTDAAITRTALKKSAKKALDNSLNIITVDGDMSPNDSLFIIANAMAQNEIIEDKGADFEKFSMALTYVCNELAKLLVKDAEGATKFIAIKVKRAAFEKQAEAIVSRLANSLLFKTMIYGGDPNWGRIICAAGSADKKLDIKKMNVYIGDKKIFGNGEPCDVDMKILRNILLKKEIEIVLDLNSGVYEALKYTCDLSGEYVKINSHYRT